MQDQNELLKRITTNPGIFGGKPIIRGIRFAVTDILELLADGMTPEEILEEHPILEPDDIPAALLYASSELNQITANRAA